MKRSVGEIIKYIRADGEEVILHTPPSRSVINMTGWGYIIPDTHTIKGPFQHGNTVLGYRFPERTISFDVIKPNCSRSEWFTERTNLVNKLGFQSTNPNLPTLGNLQWEYVVNGEVQQRAVDCYLSRGLAFSPDPQWWQYGILESLEFVAPDPFIYDPNQVTVTIDTFDEELILPMTFPFILGSAEATQTITYTGSWVEYPIIEIDGPTNGFYIENTTTGVHIQLDYAIPNDVTVTINLTTGNKSVSDDLGNNLIQYVTSDSDIAQFSLEPDPNVSGGTNVIYVSITDIDADTEIRINYYNRYIGI